MLRETTSRGLCELVCHVCVYCVCLLLQDLVQSCLRLCVYYCHVCVYYCSDERQQSRILFSLNFFFQRKPSQNNCGVRAALSPDAAFGKAPASNGNAPRRRAPPRGPHSRRCGQRVRIQELEIHKLSWRMHATAVGCQGLGRQRLHRVAAPLPRPPCSHTGVLECSTCYPDGHWHAVSLRPGWGRGRRSGRRW